MKYIGQHDISDCGPACFAMISNYYGLRYPLQRFRKLTRTGKNGTSLQGIIDGPKIWDLTRKLSQEIIVN